MDLKLRKPTGRCHICGKSTHVGNHGNCGSRHNCRKHVNQNRKPYETGRLPSNLTDDIEAPFDKIKRASLPVNYDTIKRRRDTRKEIERRKIEAQHEQELLDVWDDWRIRR